MYFAGKDAKQSFYFIYKLAKMKIITTGDWHLGNLFHGYDRLPEHRHFLEWLLNQIKNTEADALLIAGDIFDVANPSAASQEVYYEFLDEATKQNPHLQIVAVAGNHDSAYRLEAPRSLLRRHKMEIRGIVRRKWVQKEAGGYWENDYDDLMIPIEGKEGDTAVVLAVPYLRSDFVGTGGYSDGVNRFLSELTQKAREKYSDTPLIMMAHMYAKGSEIAAKDASEKIVIGGQEEVNIGNWEDHPDYFTSGHIHKRQHIWNTNWARYTGSVLPMSFSEKDYEHGVDLVTISEGKKPKWEFLKYTPQHKLVTLPEGEEELTTRQLVKLIEKILPERAENGELGNDFQYVMLKVKMDKISHEDIKAIDTALQKKNALLCKLHKVMPKLEIRTLSGEEEIKSVEDILNRDPIMTLKETFAIKHGREMSEQQELMIKKLLG